MIMRGSFCAIKGKALNRRDVKSLYTSEKNKSLIKYKYFFAMQNNFKKILRTGFSLQRATSKATARACQRIHKSIAMEVRFDNRQSILPLQSR